MRVAALQPTLTYPEAQRIVNEAVKDKTYQEYPLGQEAAAYLRVKRKRLTKSSYRDYESCLDKLARHFPYLELEDFEPPVGTVRLEEFIDHQWGDRKERTQNKNHSILHDFFEWHFKRGRLHGDPTIGIERAKKRSVHRETFSGDVRRAIVAGQDDVRDRIAVRLLLDYGLRKGALLAVQFKHFDHVRKRLTIFTKGGEVQNVPIPDPAFWHDLERLILDTEAEAHHYLIQSTKGNQYSRTRIPDKPMRDHGAHNWWYRCLEKAGIVSEGTTKGEKMHKARHTAGQRVLDATGNVKAVQALLGHKDFSTTANQYLGWEEGQLAETLMKVLEDER